MYGSKTMLRLLLLLIVLCSTACYASVASCVSESLGASWDGSIGFPGSPLYQRTLRIDNKRVVTDPDVVLAPRRERDVATAVKVINQCNSSIATLSGGHSAAGYSLVEGGVVINVREHLHHIRWQDTQKGIIRVGSGALWKHIYSHVESSGWLPIGGGCPQVGVAGFTLGGGWSFLSRSYGLAIDNLHSVNLVLANGTLVTASESSHSSLFWALRGGGGGNFGIATSFVLQMHLPKSPDGLMVAGELCWPPLDPVVLDIWDYWLRQYDSMPGWMDIDPVWLPMGEGGARMFCTTIICNNDADSCQNYLKPLLSFSPPIDSLEVQPFLTWQLANVNVTDAQEGNLYLTSGILNDGAVSLAMVQGFMNALSKAPNDRSLVLFHVGGGAIASVSPNATAFPHRSVQLVVQVKAIWEDNEDATVNIDWVNSLRTALLPYLSGSYVNYIDPNFPDWNSAYYGNNYQRLLNIQREYDPRMFFSFPQAIGKSDQSTNKKAV